MSEAPMKIEVGSAGFVDKTSGPTEKGIEGSKGKQGKFSKFFQRKIVSIPLTVLAALGIIEVGGAAIDYGVTDIKHPIISAAGKSFEWPYTLITENLLNQGVPETFNNNAGKTKFGERNITRITPQEAESKGLLEPTITVDSAGAVTVTTLLPGIFPSLIPDTQLDNTLSGTSTIPTAEKRFIMPKGYQSALPKGVHYALLRGEPELIPNQNPNLVYSINAFFYDAKSNISLSWVYQTNGLVPEAGVKTFDPKEYRTLYSPYVKNNLKDLPISDGVAPIAEPVSQNQNLDVLLFAFSGSDYTPKLDNNNLVDRSLFRQVKWEASVNSNQKLILTSS